MAAANHGHWRICPAAIHAPTIPRSNVPRVVKGGDLCLGRHTALVLEQHVVTAVGVERRVQVDQIHALIDDVLAQDGQVVAVELDVSGDRFGWHGLLGCTQHLNGCDRKYVTAS